MKVPKVSVLVFATTVFSMPRYPPTRFEPNEDRLQDISLPSAPSDTPLHTTALMALAARATAGHNAWPLDDFEL